MKDPKEEIMGLLKNCAKSKDIHKGIRLHGDIEKLGLVQTIPSLVNAIICMYAKCGMLAKAHQMHDNLCDRNVSSWNMLIEGYMQKGRGHEALNCYEQMQGEGLSPNAVTFICILKACGNKGTIGKGMSIHDQIVRNGFFLRKKKNIALGNSLVYMYAKFDMFMEARKVLIKEIPVQNVVSWSSLIAGYAQHGKAYEAFNCFEEMKNEGITPDEVTFTCMLKVCSSTRSIEMGEKLHEEVANRGLFEKNSVLGTALVDMYGKCGFLAKAQTVQDGMCGRDVISWSALVAGYVQQGQGYEALSCFKQMQSECIFPNAVTFVCLLKACGSIGILNIGEQIHSEILSRGIFDKEIAVGNALVDMYGKCGVPRKAHEVLEELPVRDVVTWSSLIGGYIRKGQAYEAFDCFEQMQREGVSPQAVTFIHILKACGITSAIKKSEQILDEILNRGLNIQKDVVLGTALVDMYAEFGMLAKARQVHDELYEHSVISWNALIAGYAEHGHGQNTFKCLKLMQNEGLLPDAVTFICILKACSRAKAIDKGKQIHEEIISRGLLEKDDIVLATSLLDMYAKCGALLEANHMHYDLYRRDVVSWLSLIEGYIRQGQDHEALHCLEQMQDEGISPNASILTCALKACGNTGSIEKGMQIHNQIGSKGILVKDIVLGNALVDMYTKYGMLAKAQEVLMKELPMRDVVSWNALIRGYAENGLAQEALNCLEEMRGEGLSPDTVTFVSILNACSHSGCLEEAQLYFHEMCGKYGITPDLEHYTCMVSVLGRVGEFNKAMSVIEMLPFPDYLPVWLTLLGACKKWGNVKVGRLAFDEAVRIDNSCGAYILMADIYIACGMQKDAEKVKSIALENKSREHIFYGPLCHGGS